MKFVKLWPPLEHIRREFSGVTPSDNADAAAKSDLTFGAVAPVPAALTTLEDLRARRQAVQSRRFSAQLGPGTLVLIALGDSARGLLLTKNLGGARWRGYLAAPECDWAGSHDVVLEPSDDPFDPLCGMIQTWNSVEIELRKISPQMILGQISSERVAAIDSVALEPVRRDPAAQRESVLGHIALRSCANGTTVLTGSPLRADDPRLEYQALYRQLVKRQYS